MISLRAISTSRRRLELLAIILMLPSFLMAASFRLAVVTDSRPYSAMLSDALALVPGPVTAPDALSDAMADDAQRAVYAREAEVSSLRRRESFAALEALSDEATSGDTDYFLEIVEPVFSPEEKGFLFSGDEDARCFLMLREDLDALVVADVEEDGMLCESTLRLNGEEVHHSLYLPSDESVEFMAILSVLTGYLKGPLFAVVRVDVPESVLVQVDGDEVKPIRGCIVLEKGEHRFSFSSPDYENAVMEADVADGTVVAPSLQKRSFGPLFVSSRPYGSTLSFRGLEQDSHLVSNAVIPFQMTLTHPGFSDLSVQSRLPMETIHVSLRPEWMADEDLIGRAKDRFYTNLIATIVSFGCYVASGSLSDIFTEVELRPVAALAAGISIVQLVELFDSMFDYYQAARLGI